MQQFPVWKRLELGTDQPTNPVAELERLGFKVIDWVKTLVAKTLFASEPTTVDLVQITVAELRFPEGASTKEIFDRATQLGLTLLPAEAGYRLRLNHADQPLYERIRIGMEPIMDSDNDLRIFYVAHEDDGQWLGARHGYPEYQWRPWDIWVFGQN